MKQLLHKPKSPCGGGGLPVRKTGEGGKMKKYDYIDRVLFAAVLWDAATEASVGSERASRTVCGIVRLLSGKEKPQGCSLRRKQMKMPTALHRILG